MFGRHKEAPPAQEAADQLAAETAAQERDRAAGKGTPTPKRKDQVAARKRPLVPNDRKAATAAAREAERAERAKVRQALDTGDERYLPLRDKGPQRRFARDYVDSRWNLGEFLMFAALLFVILSLVVPVTSSAQVYVLGAFWILFIAVFIDGFFVFRGLKKRLVTKFGFAERGVPWYGVMRAMQFRKLRLPKPLVKRGQRPD